MDFDEKDTLLPIGWLAFGLGGNGSNLCNHKCHVI